MEKVPRVVLGALIYNEKGELFLVQSYKWAKTWNIPGGHLEWGETFEECLKREVKEETNLDIEDIELIITQESIFSEEYHDKDRHFVFLDFCCKVASSDIKLNEELQEYQWFEPKEALKLNLNVPTRIFIEKYLEKKS